ncbi:hypothetical protein AX17_007472 [Amanita inopinata Kibby_2008]|nr:hypothetical protein AX17_007472 [Amanita inopinata Kibby_2008]
MLFNTLFSSVFLAIVYASTALSAPWQQSSKFTTHRTREITPGFTLETFHPASTYETFGEGIDHPLSKRANSAMPDSARSFVASQLGIPENTIAYKSGFTGKVASHAYLRQTHDGILFANAVANVAFNEADKVVSFGSSFVKPTKIASSKPSVSLEDAIASAEKTLDGKYNSHPTTLEFLVLQNGSVALTHVIQIQNEQSRAWYEAFVDAHSGKVLSVTDFVAKASYLVLPVTEETIPEGFQDLTNPQDLSASRLGWHDTGSGPGTGNNVITFIGTPAGISQQSSPTDNFHYVQDPNQEPTVSTNMDAARVNNFYLVNTVHDFTYRYGFTEAAFNFQQNNFGNGGLGDDRVTASVQDSAGINNADFATPPDGQSGHMRMFLWTFTSPERDGALENDIVVHENTHGVTNRLTGGGTARCLQTLESAGLGEGWSDAMADWTEKTCSAVPDYILGQYVTDNPAGIRSHPYSTSMTVNPLTYGDLRTRTEVHDIGEVWANILHNVYAALVEVHGWSPTARINPDGREGNIVHLHLFMDALSLQPCNPTFIDARDAWIQADANRYGGANFCTLWRVFASRGLGVKAKHHKNDFHVPHKLLLNVGNSCRE